MNIIPDLSARSNLNPPPWIHFAFLLLVLAAPLSVSAGGRTIIQLKDFDQTEVKAGGFVLPHDTQVHIHARGAGDEKRWKKGDGEMFAYGWIINAGTRELVWKMDRDNTRREKEDRVFDDDVAFKKGSYEVYFAAYAFSANSPFTSFTINIDRRKDSHPIDGVKKRGIFSWFQELMGHHDIEKEFKKRSKEWVIELAVDEHDADVTMFSPPKEFPNTLFHATRVGEKEHIRQYFSLSRPVSLRIYALGETPEGGDPVDYGWIVDVKTHKRIWEMGGSNLTNAGGAEKNVKFDGVVAFPAGEYILYYTTDDSHSYTDWNAAPPADPFNYGVTLIARDDQAQTGFKLTTPKQEQNVIVQLTMLGNSETRNACFSLKAPARVHVYAIGERANFRRQMADYGWIINANTREKVWTMEVDNTEPAGGASKNRMVDEVISLPKGTYTVYYQTDDSHAYNDWNSAPPFDPEHWGITVYGEGENFNMHNVEKGINPKTAGTIAQIVRVEDDARMSQTFALEKPTRIRIYAIGEGQNNEMFDYGYIEAGSTGKIIWQMTYSMTFHAGGGRKNRMVNTTILLDKGEYRLHYVSDDSHSFNHWNTDPPDDPTMWGITLYKEE